MITRPFRVEEIVLGDVSGQVLGTVTIDGQWGVIQRIEAQQFDFRRHQNDEPVDLDPSTRDAAIQLVEAVMEFDPDVISGDGPLILSAQSVSCGAHDSAGQQTLAEFLAAPNPKANRSLRRAE